MRCADVVFSLPPWMTSEAGEELQKKLWGEIVQELKKVEPGCLGR